MKFPLVFIGFMACGKTAMGKKLAGKLQIPFVDTDELIEETTGLSITEIFEKRGEAYFRELESRVIRRLNYSQKQLIALGGGAISFQDNLAFLKERSTLVYLKQPKRILIGRLKGNRNQRPLTANLSDEEIREMVEQKMKIRKPFYRQADLVIEMQKMTHKQILKLLLKT